MYHRLLSESLREPAAKRPSSRDMHRLPIPQSFTLSHMKSPNARLGHDSTVSRVITTRELFTHLGAWVCIGIPSALKLHSNGLISSRAGYSYSHPAHRFKLYGVLSGLPACARGVLTCSPALQCATNPVGIRRTDSLLCL